jgi:hypothetical protein
MTEQPRIRVFCVDDHPLLRGNGDIAEKLFITEETQGSRRTHPSRSLEQVIASSGGGGDREPARNHSVVRSAVARDNTPKEVGKNS